MSQPTKPGEAASLAESPPELATIPDIQKMNGGESRAGIYRALSRGELRAVKRGRRTLIIVESARERIRNMPVAAFRPPRGAK